MQKGGVYNSNVLNDGSETIAERDLEAVSRLIDVLPGQHIDGRELIIRIKVISIHICALRLVLIRGIGIETTTTNPNA